MLLPFIFKVPTAHPAVEPA